MTPPLANEEIAQRLDAFAVLLELAGSERYTSRAYRRAAETIRETPAPVAELARAGRAQELRGIGPGIARRLSELVETGTIAELDELERDFRPELVGLGRLVGVSTKRMLEIGRVLGVRTVEELHAAAREGRLQEVPGIGPHTERQILERLGRDPATPRQGLTLNRARAVTEEVAAALGGEVAGDPRRWADVSFDLAVVVAADEPDPVLERFESLPAIVAVVEREARRALGVTVDGVPLELIVAEPDRFGTELLRATGSRAYVEALGPLPAAADEQAVYAALGVPWCPPELREGPFRGRRRRARRAGRRPRRPALPHDLVGREGVRARDGHRGERPRLRVHRDLRPHAQRAGRAGPRRRRPPSPGGGDRGRQRAARAVPHPPRQRGRHPQRREPRPPGRRAGGARLGAAQPPRRPARGARAADAEGHRGDAPSGGDLPQPPARPDRSTTDLPTRSTSTR